MTEPDRERARALLAVAGIDRHADAEAAIAAALAAERELAHNCRCCESERKGIA